MSCQFQMYRKVNYTFFIPFLMIVVNAQGQVYVNVNSGSHVNGKRVKGASFMSTSNSINEITRQCF